MDSPSSSLPSPSASGSPSSPLKAMGVVEEDDVKFVASVVAHLKHEAENWRNRYLGALGAMEDMQSALFNAKANEWILIYELFCWRTHCSLKDEMLVAYRSRSRTLYHESFANVNEKTDATKRFQQEMSRLDNELVAAIEANKKLEDNVRSLKRQLKEANTRIAALTQGEAELMALVPRRDAMIKELMQTNAELSEALMGTKRGGGSTGGSGTSKLTSKPDATAAGRRTNSSSRTDSSPPVGRLKEFGRGAAHDEEFVDPAKLPHGARKPSLASLARGDDSEIVMSPSNGVGMDEQQQPAHRIHSRYEWASDLQSPVNAFRGGSASPDSSLSPRSPRGGNVEMLSSGGPPRPSVLSVSPCGPPKRRSTSASTSGTSRVKDTYGRHDALARYRSLW